MKKSLIIILLFLCPYIIAFSQRIVKSALDQYPSYNDATYNFGYDYSFDRTFKLSDGSIITISTNQCSLSITKWGKELQVLDKTEIEQSCKQVIYHSFFFNDNVYLFAYEKLKDEERLYYYYEMSCADKLSIQIKKNTINEYVFCNEAQQVCMINADRNRIRKIDIVSFQSETMQLPVQNTGSKIFFHDVKDGYTVFTYKTENTAKSKEPSNSILETFIFECRTFKINKMSIDFLLDKNKSINYEIAVKNDSIYFITYSNEEEHLTLKYKILGYDFSENKSFLEKSASVTFIKKFYHRSLSTMFFSVDPNTGNLILVLNRYQELQRTKNTIMPISIGGYGGIPINAHYSRYHVFTGYYYKIQMDYPVIYMNPEGNVLNVDFIYWPKQEAEDQTLASFFPKIIFSDGLLYIFTTQYRMSKMTCWIYNMNGTLKEKILLFENDPVDSDNVNSSTIHSIGDGLYVFATIPNRFGKTGNYYMFKVHE